MSNDDLNRSAVTTALLAVFAGLAGVAGSYALAGATPSFVGAPVSAFVVNTTPAPVVAFSIQTLGEVGDLLAFGTGLVLTVFLFAVASVAGIELGRRTGVPFGGALLAAAFGWLLAVALTGAPVTALGVAVPVLAVVVVASDPASATGGLSRSRRRLLAAAAGAAGFTLAGYLLGNRRTAERQSRSALSHASSSENGSGPAVGGASAPDMPSVSDLASEAESKSLGVEGIPGLVSSIDSFYRVDISSIDPNVNANDWSLSVTGQVDHEVTLSYDDLTSMTPTNRFKTLRCVGEQLNAKLLDNAIWTGVPIADVLDRASSTGACDCVMVRAADDYYEEFPLTALRNGFLAYGMNGEVLPRNHGYPVRLLVPGHWGEINVKWITEIELLDKPATGYWEKRGWHGTGPVNTVAKLWTVNRLDSGVQVAGHAYAGTRGIERVEVSTDGGGTWADATLSESLSDGDTWRQWAYEWNPPSGSHEVVVRAVDGTGAVQPRADQQPYPSGATGWVSRTVDV